MRFLRGLLFCCVILYVVMLGTSMEARAESAWIGAGVASCSEFAKFYREDPKNENLFYLWAMGYMSGVNTPMMRRSSTDLAKLDTRTQLQVIRQYCDANPLAPYAKAVMFLFQNMRDKQGLPDWRVVTNW